MANGLRDTTATPAALLELKEEQKIIQEGYDFLDEKRLLLAAEVMRQLKQYHERMDEFQALHRRAVAALADAVLHHGLQGLEVYPASTLSGAQIKHDRHSFLGVALTASRLEYEATAPRAAAVNPSAEARRCRELFRELIERSAVIAGISSNLFRLLAEYRRTERRARALEDVILPEIDEALRGMQTQLEETDQEEAIRTRLSRTAQATTDDLGKG